MGLLRHRQSKKLRLRILVALIPSFFFVHQYIIVIRQSTSAIMDINYQSVSSMIIVNMSSPTEQTRSSSNALILDVASIGSNTRLEYMKAQQETWASKDYIRHVFETTEDDDLLSNCTISKFPTEQDIKRHVNSCRISHKRDKNFKHLYHYLHAHWVLNKAHPAGWLCAQHRPGTALYKALQSYSNNNNNNSTGDSLPDYLMLVDDDTYYNIPRLTPLLQASKNVATVNVGCLTILKSTVQPNLYRAAPFGGGGMILSKQTLQRLLEPIHCSDDNDNDSDVNNIEWCQQVNLNLLGEQDVFRNGMTMGELIYQFYNQHPNCFISDWPLAYFINYYNLADVHWTDFPDKQAKAVKTVPITEASVQLFYDDPQWKQQQQQQQQQNISTTNLCPLLQDPKTQYPPGVLVGHYLSPNKMHQLYKQSKQ